MTTEQTIELRTEDQTIEFCFAVVRETPFSLTQYIDEKTPNICFEAIKKYVDLFYKI